MVPESKNGERLYGRWAGKPTGEKEDPELCLEEVWDRFMAHQCLRRRGHGPDGAFCKQHAKKYALR